MNTPTSQSILVSGGAGFILSHLVETLVTDNDVTVLDNLPSGRREWVAVQAALIEADTRNSEAVEEAAAGADISGGVSALQKGPRELAYLSKVELHWLIGERGVEWDYTEEDLALGVEYARE